MITTSEKQTFNLGKKLAAKLKGGEVLALTGPLGAGKTVLIKGIAAGLGIKQIITSPTFVLMKVYNVNRLPFTAYRHGKQSAVSGKRLAVSKLVHLDCYRLNEPRAIKDIGAPDYFGRPETITVIEWAEKIKDILPALQTKKIAIKLKGGNKRKITLK